MRCRISFLAPVAVALDRPARTETAVSRVLVLEQHRRINRHVGTIPCDVKYAASSHWRSVGSGTLDGHPLLRLRGSVAYLADVHVAATEPLPLTINLFRAGALDTER